MPRTPSERRRHPRTQLLRSAQVQFNGRPRSALCVDFSHNGVGLVVEAVDPPAKGEAVEVLVKQGGQHALHLSGEVVHTGVTRPDKIGVRFGKLTRESRLALESLLD